MQSSATHKYLRISPRKVRLVADLIKGKNVADAKAILRFTIKGATEPLEKALRSAIASATTNLELEESNLYVSKVIVNEGPKLKRFRPRARGRAFPIQKKTSHITLVVDEINPTTGTKKKVQKKTETPVMEIPGGEQTDPKKVSGSGPKFRPAKDIAKPKKEGGVKRMFRRKAV